MALGMNHDQLAELVAAHDNHVRRLIKTVEDLQIRVDQLEQSVKPDRSNEPDDSVNVRLNRVEQWIDSQPR